ncbi:MAG: hypothetical protein QW232_09705 [Saccharolobus sp.]
MAKKIKIKGYIGHVKINDQGKVEESNMENAEKIAEFISFNVKKGNEEAKELGFNKLHGFAMFGSDNSLAFMKNLALVVDTDKTDFNDLFTYYTFNKSFCVTGVALVIISIILFYFALFTALMNFIAPEPRLYIPSLVIIIGVIFLAISRTRLAYRLE